MPFPFSTLCNQLGASACLAVLAVASLASTEAVAQSTPAVEAAKPTAPAAIADVNAAKPTAAKTVITIILAREVRDRPTPLSLLDIPPADDGIAGAKLGIGDNNTTGRFLNQEYVLDVVENAKPAQLVSDVVAKLGERGGFIIADAAPETILALADAAAAKGGIVVNASSPDESLREENCRANLVHTIPSRSMLTDALAQYLAFKRWNKWFLVAGTQPDDKAYADALRRSAKRFGHTIVEERTFEYDVGSRRTDGGHEQVQQQIPTFMQNAKAHDVVVVADEGELFGEHIPYRTWDPRPVAGTAGLTPATSHPSIEQWGGTQFQNRFKRLANRTMRPLDYNMWLAMRSVGEAASRKQTNDPKALFAYMQSPDFDLAAFKGTKTTFRNWNGQLRQPLFVVTSKVLVSVSPQQGFLHQFSPLDTMGFDKPESKCKAYTAK